MQLSVSKFFDYRPASQWAFDIVFSDILMASKVVNERTKDPELCMVNTDTFTELELERLSSAVVSVTQPKYTIEPDIRHYGNFNFVVPKYDSTNMTITITFEETDDCLISHKLIGSLMGNVAGKDVPAWLNVHPVIVLGLLRYNAYNVDELKTNGYKDAHGTFVPTFHNKNLNSIAIADFYSCQMIEYTEPAYNRTGASPNAATCTITFMVTPVPQYATDESEVLLVKPSDISVENVWDQLADAAKQLYTKLSVLVQASTGWLFSNFGTANTNLELLNKANEQKIYNSSTWLEHNISDTTLRGQFKQLKMGASGEYAATSGQTIDDIISQTKVFEQTGDSKQLRANLMALTTALQGVSTDLNKLGFTLVVGFVNNDGSHDDNFGSKSHMYNDKADVYLIDNKTRQRITATDWAKDDKLRVNITDVFNTHGLHTQAETSSIAKNNNLWLDTWIWKGYVSTGKELTGYGNSTNWGSYVLYDTSLKKGI